MSNRLVDCCINCIHYMDSIVSNSCCREWSHENDKVEAVPDTMICEHYVREVPSGTV